jgi:hypothetical protein
MVRIRLPPAGDHESCDTQRARFRLCITHAHSAGVEAVDLMYNMAGCTAVYAPSPLIASSVTFIRSISTSSSGHQTPRPYRRSPGTTVSRMADSDARHQASPRDPPAHSIRPKANAWLAKRDKQFEPPSLQRRVCALPISLATFSANSARSARATCTPPALARFPAARLR